MLSRIHSRWRVPVASQVGSKSRTAKRRMHIGSEPIGANTFTHRTCMRAGALRNILPFHGTHLTNADSKTVTVENVLRIDRNQGARKSFAKTTSSQS